MRAPCVSFSCFPVDSYILKNISRIHLFCCNINMSKLRSIVNFGYKDPVVFFSCVIGLLGGALPFISAPFKSEEKPKVALPKAR
ncbi:mitochondrial Complex I (CI) NADH:ubiquinone oxidoreductase subunit B9/NI9M/NDUFA3 [Andalucia godoyi]|uniref:Mitochondrial Complex I (CI) NADH:ubiquinone oxidoreductase subunit B9/NI9M/NDUFA3 n=1 Tax=Andalucia godoyi TaxID=505711 RepID=A0A8K0AIV1_ANDGO|nr:mitochondrial Complex I (CI) NADH:ubiquinone oxidoreductase subunit B9/NI9M/NDUFA3 [Andalucia godoyi]|eukprot:ANDGO_06253.mRNA.1 mitochondrial Complex I (CI) NADH:ubiquinone oxidoreductase subunit B9/NI9M/NDUFA3